MEDNIIDAVVNQIKLDLNYNDTTAIEEMLKLLYSKKNHEIYKHYLPEELWAKYENYDHEIKWTAWYNSQQRQV